MGASDVQTEWTAIVETTTGRESVRVTARREHDSALDDWTVWHATVDHPAGEGWPDVADKREERAVLAAVMNPGAAWRWRLVSLARVGEAPDASRTALEAARHALASLGGLVVCDAASPRFGITLDESAAIAAIDAVLGTGPGPAIEPTWVPWPTSTGYWWARACPEAPLCIVEARVEAESSWIYFTGNECPLYANEPREPWEFCPAEPPR